MNNMYKISVNNLGYENEGLGKLEGFQGTLKECKSKINTITNDFRLKKLENHKIEYLTSNEEIKEENFKNDCLEILQVIGDIDRNICIWKIYEII